MWIALVAGIVYACAAFLAVQLSAAVCRGIVAFDDGPRPAKPNVAVLVAAAFAVGTSLGWRGADAPLLGVYGLLVAALVACSYSDVRCGIVPDYFTLVPLAVLLGGSILVHDYDAVRSAAIVFTPFAIAAFLSKGRGMGWGDVKLVALGAAVLGLQTSVLAFAGACLTAVVVSAVRRKRSEPIAFAPYLAGAIGVALAAPTLVP